MTVPCEVKHIIKQLAKNNNKFWGQQANLKRQLIGNTMIEIFSSRRICYTHQALGALFYDLPNMQNIIARNLNKQNGDMRENPTQKYKFALFLVFRKFFSPRCPNSFSRDFLHANSFKVEIENLRLICICSVVFPSNLKYVKFTFLCRIREKC